MILPNAASNSANAALPTLLIRHIDSRIGNRVTKERYALAQYFLDVERLRAPTFLSRNGVKRLEQLAQMSRRLTNRPRLLPERGSEVSSEGALFFELGGSIDESLGTCRDVR